MLKTEKRAAFSLALVYALRMLGLFMILPVFSLHAQDYSGTTPILIGLAIGIYGLTQGLFQIPFGFASDLFGRKTVIVAGLLIFAVGSVVAAEASSIQQVIVGRALQGLGAIAAAVMALAADLTREEVRLRIMAIIGMSIGASFMISMVLGPTIAAAFGLRWLFWMTAGLALLGILVILLITPQPAQQRFHRDAQVSFADIGKALANAELIKLGLGVFLLHLVLSATFVMFPLLLRLELGVAEARHWQLYLPVFALSIVGLVPLVLVAEKLGRQHAVFLLAILMLAAAEYGLSRAGGYWMHFALLVLFFSAFNFLEAMLPAAVTRVAAADMKGTAMGLFSSAQFFGAFCGGVLGGALLGFGELRENFVWLAVLLLPWLLVALRMRIPEPVASRIVSLAGLEAGAIDQFTREARALDGVREVVVYPEDEVAYLKVERGFDDQVLLSLKAN